MVNNSKSVSALTGDGLAGKNGGQTASTNKMNVVMNKLIKALNKYMEPPKEAIASANKVNATPSNVAEVMATVTPTVQPINVNNKNKNNVAQVNVINPITSNIPVNTPAKTPVIVTSNNSKRNNTKKNKAAALNSRRARIAFKNANSFRGGRRTRYNRMKTRRHK